MRLSFRGTAYVAAGLALAVPISGSGYTIGLKTPIHERLAAMSERCAIVDGVIVTESYGQRISCKFDQVRLLAARKATSRHVSKQTPVETSARWGDDPGSGLNRLGRGLDYLFRFEFKCPSKPYDKMTIYDAGVMCSGHYGRLGFFHAMMSSDDATLPAARGQANTQAKIIAWAAFTYDVARGKLTSDTPFCAEMMKRRDLAASFDDGAGCAGAGARWTIGDFFSFACANPRPDQQCDRLPNSDMWTVRRGAMGSLLHMIQDSYAQGHVIRGEERQNRVGGKMVAIIVCARPTYYYYYDKADLALGHPRADKEPLVDPGCGNATIDDPVSAGATLLWMLRNDVPSDKFVDYLLQRVFPDLPT